VLDHIIVSQSLAVTDFLYARSNADFPESLRGDGSRPERVSDHDAAVAYFGVTRDTAPPVVAVTGVSEGATYLLGAVPAGGCNTQDALSGVGTPATLHLSGGDVNGVGSITATCSGAVDKVGNTADPVSVTYKVVAYSFSGFGSPLSSGVTTVKGGSTVPVKFQITDWNGNVVSNTSVITAIQVVSLPSCNGAASGEWTDAAATGGTSLRFDSTSNQFIFNWKTSGLAGCYQLGVTTSDTLVHSAVVAVR
jgi:hypothetical protein